MILNAYPATIDLLVLHVTEIPLSLSLAFLTKSMLLLPDDHITSPFRVMDKYRRSVSAFLLSINNAVCSECRSFRLRPLLPIRAEGQTCTKAVQGKQCEDDLGGSGDPMSINTSVGLALKGGGGHIQMDQ